MSSQNPLPAGGANPLAPLAQIVDWLASAVLQTALGLAIGIAAARVLRSRQLHWSWGAVALAITFALRPLLGTAAPAAMLAALSATVLGRRWHRADLEAGVDLARVACRRRQPVDVMRVLVQRIRERRGRVAAPARASAAGQLVLGPDRKGRAVSIPFGGQGGGSHCLIAGSTGSGKTITQTRIAVAAIERGMAVVVVDPKGDRGMRDRLSGAALAAERRFIEWTPAGPCVYNPYGRGTETEIADKALSSERFTEPHYLRQAQRYLGHELRAMRAAGLPVSLRSIVEHLEPDALEVLARSLQELQAERTFAYLDSLTARQRSDLAGVRDRLAILVESDVGRWLDPASLGGAELDLLAAVRSRAVVYFDLDCDSRPLLSTMLGAAVVQDLQTVVAALQRRPVRSLAVIDEFSALAAGEVVRLFGRARSAGLSLVVSTQELADLRLPGREKLLEQVMGNLSVLIAHRQVVPESAQLISALAGTRGAWRYVGHSDGRSTRSRTQVPLLGADEVTSLGVGWAAAIVLTQPGQPRIARVLAA